MTARQTAILLAIALTWGASFLFIKVMIDDGVDPLGISAGRTLLGAMVLWAIVLRGDRAALRMPRWTWAGLALLGLVQFAIPWTLFGIAERSVPSGVASIANSTNPLWAALLAAFFLQADRIRGVRALGLVVGFAGVLVLMGGDLTDVGGDAFAAVLLLVVATMCYAVSTVSIRRWLGHVPPIPLAAAQVGFAAVFLMPAALATGAYSGARFETGTWLSLAGLGALGSGLAVAGYMMLIQEIGPVRASVVTYLLPPIGVFLGWLVLDEGIGWNLAGGLACVVAGVALVQGIPAGRLLQRGVGHASAETAPAAAPAD